MTEGLMGVLMILLTASGEVESVFVPSPPGASLQQCEEVAARMLTNPPADMREDPEHDEPFSVLKASCIRWEHV